MTVSTATLEWRYQPVNLLGAAQTMEAHGAIVTIGDGVIRAEIEATHYQADRALTEKLQRVINARLAPYAYQCAEPVIVDTYPTLTITHADGRPREIHVDSFISLRITDTVDIQIYRDDILIQDTAQERDASQKAEAELLSKHANDDLLSRLLVSNTMARHNHENEFTHLYEILEALQARFGKPPRLTDALNIEKSKIGKFHAVCNVPTTVSRHRGQTSGLLRPPTAEEFTHARSFAWEMILAYARWLEANP